MLADTGQLRWLNVEYGADVPASTNYVASYDTSGGLCSEGEIGYEPPP